MKRDFLSACFNDEAHPLVSCRNTWDSTVWEDLLRIASEERVLPALHARLRELAVSSNLPPEIANVLSAVEALNGERNESILAELVIVASLLNQVGIEPVLLKGAAYCAIGVYPNPAARYMLDVDLLIPKPQLPIAVEILKQNGFEEDQSDRFCRFRHHHPALRRPRGIAFELHHSLGMGICRSLLPASEVLAQSTAQTFQGARVRVPCPEHLMVHLIMHSQIQHPYHERIWPPVRAMYDLTLLRRRFANEIDWSAIQRRFRRAGQSGVLELHLLQAQDVLGGETPFPISLTRLTRLRWLRRRLLRRLPVGRFFDPIYLYSTLIKRRLRLLQNALHVPGGWKYIAKELLAPGVYKRVLTEIILGYGR